MTRKVRSLIVLDVEMNYGCIEVELTTTCMLDLSVNSLWLPRRSQLRDRGELVTRNPKPGIYVCMYVCTWYVHGMYLCMNVSMLVCMYVRYIYSQILKCMVCVYGSPLLVRDLREAGLRGQQRGRGVRHPLR